MQMNDLLILVVKLHLIYHKSGRTECILTLNIIYYTENILVIHLKYSI